VFFRTEYGLSRNNGPFRFPAGYEAQIALEKGIGPKKNFRTGSIFDLAPVEAKLVQPNTWFAMEVIATGNRLLIKVDGKDASSVTDVQRLYHRGHLALQAFGRDTRVEFRKIEVKEL
jgi:hypothetical protein